MCVAERSRLGRMDCSAEADRDIRIDLKLELQLELLVVSAKVG